MQVLRAQGCPAVVVRPRGPRRFQEIPASEVAAVMDRLEAKGVTGGDLHRTVLAFFDTRRMTIQIEGRLRWIGEHRGELRSADGPRPFQTRMM